MPSSKSKTDIPKETTDLMASLMRMKPKPQDELKTDKPKRKQKKSPAKKSQRD